MPLDRRLREEFQRAATTATTSVSPDALTSVTHRAGQLRRNRHVAAAVSVAAVVVVALLAVSSDQGLTTHGVQPGTTPAPSTTRSSLDRTFSSSVHGFTMAYPSGWTVAAAEGPSAPDTFRSPAGATITVTAQPLPAGQTEDQWVAEYLPDAGGSRRRDCFPPRDEWLPVDVGGQAGGLLAGDFGCDLTETVVFVDRRVYIVDAVPELPTGLFDQGLLDQMLASVRFVPPAGQ